MQTNRIHISESFGGRLDPLQFHYERMDMIHNIMSTKQWCKLKDVVRNVKTTTKELSVSDVYIGLENITSNTGDYIPTSEKGTISSAAVFTKGDILFPKLRPYLNKVYRAEFNGKCSTEFHVFQAKKIDADFLTIVLRSNLVVAQTKHLMTGNTLPRLQTSDIENLIIPLPPVSVQREIVELYTKAQAEKQAKEAQAKALLDGVDSYLLTELGITLPKTSERQLVFKVKCSDILGQRLDTSFYKDKFELISTKYQNKKLSDIVIINPSVNLKSFNDNDEITFIPMEVVDEIFGTIVENRITTISNTKGFTKFEDNDLLWAKITPCMQNGKSAIARNLKNGIGCGSTEFYVLRPKDSETSIEYIYLLLRHHKVLESAKNSFGGSAGQQRVSSGYLKSISIPTPPIEVQKNIATTIELRKAQANQLQAEASQALDTAKNKIEKLILE